MLRLKLSWSTQTIQQIRIFHCVQTGFIAAFASPGVPDRNFDIRYHGGLTHLLKGKTIHRMIVM
jgi:hypothetical protein